MKKISMLSVNKAADKALRSQANVVYRRTIHNGMLQVFATREEFIEFNRSVREHGDRVEA